MLIDIIKLEVDLTKQYRAIDNANPRVYGSGKIVEVRTRNDDISTHAPRYLVVEMAGELVPVRTTILPEHGVRYDAYDLKFPEKAGYAIEWDTDRWLLERWTSPHVSKSLKEFVTTDMAAAGIDGSRLSASDAQGIRWDENNLGYIKVRKKFVPIHLGERSYVGTSGKKEIYVEYRHNQFHRSEFEKRQRSDSVALRFYGKIKELSTSAAQEGQLVVNFGAVLQSMFSNEHATVEQVPSSSLDKKRLLVSVADEQYVLESSKHNQNLDLLAGEESEQALSKHRGRASGGNIKHVFGLRQRSKIGKISVPGQAKRDEITYAHVRNGARQIRGLLERQKEKGIQGKMLVLGHADFLQTDVFGEDVFSSPDVLYLALHNMFTPLSTDYPDAIIVPGSMSISSLIPDIYQGSNIRYRQAGVTRKVEEMLSFSATIAPVFHGGKLIAAARKGEYLTHQFPDFAQEQSRKHDAVRFTTLERGFPQGTLLSMGNDSIPFDDRVIERLSQRRGTIFAGKTLIPQEKEMLEWLLHSTADVTQSHIAENFFNNEFMVGDEKFLLIIEDEFEQNPYLKSSVRSLALDESKSVEDGSRYDWILHTSAGQTIDARLRAAGDNYLHADHGDENAYISEYHQRLQVRSYWEEENLYVYDYKDD